MIARLVIGLLIVVIGAFTYPGELIVSLATRIAPQAPAAAGPEGAMPWLHVAHPSGGRPYIADDKNRLVLLHGAIPASLLEFGPGSGPVYPLDRAAYQDGQCPPNSRTSRYPPLCMTDLSQMAALGFNSVRLPISWSLLEPQRGMLCSIRAVLMPRQNFATTEKKVNSAVVQRARRKKSSAQRFL